GWWSGEAAGDVARNEFAYARAIEVSRHVPPISNSGLRTTTCVNEIHGRCRILMKIEHNKVYTLLDTGVALVTNVSSKQPIALLEHFAGNDATIIATAVTAKKHKPTCSKLILRDFLAK